MGIIRETYGWLASKMMPRGERQSVPDAKTELMPGAPQEQPGADQPTEVEVTKHHPESSAIRAEQRNTTIGRIAEYFAERPTFAVQAVPRGEMDVEDKVAVDLQLRTEYAKFLDALPENLQTLLPTYPQLKDMHDRDIGEFETFIQSNAPSLDLGEQIAVRFGALATGVQELWSGGARLVEPNSPKTTTEVNKQNPS